MDSNGQRFWLLAEERHWHRPGDPPAVQWDGERRSLRLASRRDPPAWIAYKAEALSRLERVPEAADAFGTRARWSTGQKQVMATGALEGEVPICTTPGGQDPSDIALGHDGVVYLAVETGATGGEMAMVDRRQRREPATIVVEGFRPWRVASDPAGGVWVMDRAARLIAHTTGGLWPKRPYGPYSPGTFRPVDENPDPPRISVRVADAWEENETAAGIACGPDGRLAVLTWAADGQGMVRLVDPETDRIGPPVRLRGGRFPFSIAWVAGGRLAILLSRVNEAPVYATDDWEGEAAPVGDLYPLRGHDGGPFLHGLSLPPLYGTDAAPRPLNRLSLPHFAARGTASSKTFLDGGSTQTVWHRLYVEAAIPAGCGIVVRLAATDEPASPIAADEWHEHRFGSAFAVPDGSQAPVGAWVPEPSEIAYQPGMLKSEPERDRAGLFTVLVQRPGRRVRSLRGRYLWVRVELVGTGRASPELAALRAYASRFSYLDNYLPELYRETAFGPDADAPGTATAPDFLDRFLGNFEGILTPLEDRIAGAHLLTDPRTAPAEALEWVAGWVGMAFDPALAADRRRALLAAAPEMARRRGTLRGLALALDLATGGAVRGGEIVVLEDFRLRRTFATILGADLSEDEDPLLGGISVSGNSYVGDTLFLGDESRKEFLARFGGALPKTKDEQAAIDALYDGLAHRVTVLVHQEVDPQDLGLIARVVQRETPAHVQAKVMATTYPFLVGMASLVGVDTYLGPRPPRLPVRVERSYVGISDFLITPVSLDPRLEGGSVQVLRPGSAPPVADAGEPLVAERGYPFELDGSGSHADPGRTLEWYRWKRLP
ncbi:MAG TPA: phage tail protein [Longimicrobiaceae bacterium]|jgi:phage tail-like protein|nr:phage tail protein [Longimicrobiaceae bacterium]